MGAVGEETKTRSAGDTNPPVGYATRQYSAELRAATSALTIDPAPGMVWWSRRAASSTSWSMFRGAVAPARLFMRIKTTNTLILLVALPLLGGWILSNRTEQRQLQAQETAETTLPAALLALDQLRQGSDRLTADVRAFAATGDTRWRDDFEAEVARDRNRTKAVEKLKALGLTGDESRLLDNTLARSTALIALEDQAFAAAGAKRFSDAIALVYGEEYRTRKAEILDGLDQFRGKLTERLNASLDVAQQGARTARFIRQGCIIAAAVLLLFTLGFFYVRVVRPLDVLKHDVDDLLVAQHVPDAVACDENELVLGVAGAGDDDAAAEEGT
jgi:hypothetical protein